MGKASELIIQKALWRFSIGKSFRGEMFYGVGDVIIGGLHRGTIVGASAPRAAPRETFVREPFRKKPSARKPYRATPFGGRRLQTPTARNRLPARPPLCGLGPAYLTEGDPRPGPPGDRARGSPSRCGGHTSMAASG